MNAGRATGVLAAAVDGLHRGLVVAAALSLLVLFVLVVLQVVLRYGFGMTPYFSSEIAGFALVWTVLAGTAASVAGGGHIRVSLLSEVLPPRADDWMQAGFDALAAVLFGVLTWAAVRTVGYAVGQTSDGLQVPLQWPYLALPACFGACLVFALRRLVRSARARSGGGGR